MTGMAGRNDHDEQTAARSRMWPDLTPDEMETRADALVEYGNSLPDGVTTEAFAEAENLRREARQVRSAARTHYQAVIKINLADDRNEQGRDIEEGIGYACALLLDEYGRTGDEIASLLERVTDDVMDSEAQRGE